MSPKQRIYREILLWALPCLRNGLSAFCLPSRRPRLLPPSRQRYMRRQYEIAQFVHTFYDLVWDGGFTPRDIHFLNSQARDFFECGDESDLLHGLMALFIQDLFALVPEEIRAQLTWPGPQGDYSWARPRRAQDPG